MEKHEDINSISPEKKLETPAVKSEWENMEPETEKAPTIVDLHTPEYDELFGKAEYYIKTAPVTIVPVTAEGLASGEYADKDVSYDKEKGKYVCTTWSMVDNKETGKREAKIEQVREVNPGDWLATNPKKFETDHLNNYPMSDKSFRKTYQASDQENIYYKIVPIKIIENPTGHDITIIDPWKQDEGVTMSGDAHCRLAENYKGFRYIISENDFNNTYVKTEAPESEA